MDSIVGDEAIIATNDNASECKRCAVQIGYWQDKYINHFVRHAERKPPEINRGYYARIKGVERLIRQFLQKCGNNAQIISIGAGFDTLYWRMKDEGLEFGNFVEMDFPTVTSRKCHLIKKSKVLLEKLHTEDGEVRFSSTDLHGSGYHLVGGDLRSLPEVRSKLGAGGECGLDPSLPTLFLAECVLVYVDAASTGRLLDWISSTFSSVFFVNYEQLNIGDKFGEVMQRNLRSRGCSLAGIEACLSKEGQEQRFTSHGWEGSKCWDMIEVYNSLPQSDMKRVEALEFLDERELLLQLFQHYCISIAWREAPESRFELSSIDIH
ncbi:leucine carboxyl methyltransferase 1 [Hetaerina americana]|uniref:leucine carboxyl methyltransferase 1 n=1 Tax=Hetaerina americana TaxID=62018 RepID=UPI003A7F5E6D